MVDIKKDFDQYLLLKSDSKKSFQQIIKKPLLNLNDWFQKDESIDNDKSVNEVQECIPKMGCVTRNGKYRLLKVLRHLHMQMILYNLLCSKDYALLYKPTEYKIFCKQNDPFSSNEEIIFYISYMQIMSLVALTIGYTRTQRIVAFTICLLTGGLFFSISMMYIPVLLLKARKFAILYTFATVFFILSFAFLWGPTSCIKYMFSKERITITCLYCLVAVATIYFALHVQSTPLTIISVVLELIILIWLILYSVPGGVTGIKVFSKLFSRTVSTTLPV